MKRRTKRRSITVSAAIVSIVFLVGVPFTGLAALEPERIQTKHGHVLAW